MRTKGVTLVTSQDTERGPFAHVTAAVVKKEKERKEQ